MPAPTPANATTHTKGEWKTDGPTLRSGASISRTIVDGNGNLVVEVMQFDGNPLAADFESNARKIAALPDIVEACKKALTCASISPAVREVIVAALAKAR